MSNPFDVLDLPLQTRAQARRRATMSDKESRSGIAGAGKENSSGSNRAKRVAKKGSGAAGTEERPEPTPATIDDAEGVARPPTAALAAPVADNANNNTELGASAAARLLPTATATAVDPPDRQDLASAKVAHRLVSSFEYMNPTKRNTQEDHHEAFSPLVDHG